MDRKLPKRLSALLCAFLLCFSLIPAPAKAASDGLTATVDGSEVRLSYSGPSESALVFCASYADGKLESILQKTCAKGGSVTFPYARDGHYQFMAVEPSTLKPLCVSVDALRVYDGPVEVPFVNDESEAVAAATVASVSAYTRAQQLTEALSGLGAEVESIKDGGTLNKTLFEDLNQQLTDAVDAWDQVTEASSLLYTAAGNLAAAQEAALQSVVAPSGLSYDEIALMADDLEWAKQVTRAYDSIRSSTKLKELGMMMGCDARRAYLHLQMAQNILTGHAYGDFGNCAEKWEKTYTGIKTGAKVGLFVCATIATAGGTAAISAGTATVTAGQAVGIVVGGVDCALEVTSTTGKIILGPGSRIVQRFEDKTKPISEACFFYSICTGGGDTLGEKLACLGDIATHEPDYQTIAYTYVYDQATNSFRLVAANCKDPEALNKLKKEILGADKLTDKVPPLDDVIKDFLKGADHSPEKLDEILKRAQTEGIISPDATIKQLKTGFDGTVAKDGGGGEVTVTTEGDNTLIERWNDEGKLDGEQLTVDADGRIVETAYYENDELIFSSTCRYFTDENTSSSYIFERDGVSYDPRGKISQRRTTYPNGDIVTETFSYQQSFHVNIDYNYIYSKSLWNPITNTNATLVPRHPVG